MKWYLKLILNIFPSGRKLIKNIELLKLENIELKSIKPVKNITEKKDSNALSEDDYKVFFYKG